MSRAEDDEIERKLAAQREAEITRDARGLTGHEVRDLREALSLARTALSRINTKGLAVSVQRDVVNARLAIDRAQPIVAARRRPPGAAEDPPTPSAGTAG